MIAASRTKAANSSRMTVPLICPYDRHVLEVATAGLCCGLCGRTFPIQNGVICTLGRLDDFYEGAYESETRFLPRSERPWHVWPLWLINSGYLWTVRRFVPQGATVVELGCAAGVRYFGQRYRMVGCDLSLSSLARLRAYECRVQADAKVCIPLPSNSVDAVISSYFWEHIPPEAKPLVLSEARRILRPGGKIIFLYDVKTQNPLIRKYQEQDPDQYDRLFIAGDGHLGYQLPAENLNAFEEAGFQVVLHRGLEKTWLQSPSAYTKLAQFGPREARFFGWLSRMGQPPIYYFYTALMRLIDALICPWLPMEWARICLVVCRREDG